MEIRPLHSEVDYEATLVRVSALVDMDPEVGTPDGDELEILSILVERYEAEHFPMERPDPIEAIRFRMEQAGLGVQDMAEYIGPKHRVYEILNGRRHLTLPMIRRLHQGLNIPASVLIGEAV
ncbi:helix-turn-helix domain-containing protein [Pararobbsia silviterrae]|uniref:Transcriptional regulator n=1 Tax=Pararobbsia silviterrae TaxID=1792498 RepID=A0A494X1U0_9BURK|nr:transcriptional regulator [Pararobbsia silviterrae]RKP44698.1 transcriptional regulator [Pararobbsia silviterrae]